jgi:hypothetical protein
VTRNCPGVFGRFRAPLLEKACPWEGWKTRQRSTTLTTSLWQHMADLPSGRRCWYGNNPRGQPCHLYFDLGSSRRTSMVSMGCDGGWLNSRVARVGEVRQGTILGPFRLQVPDLAGAFHSFSLVQSVPQTTNRHCDTKWCDQRLMHLAPETGSRN